MVWFHGGGWASGVANDQIYGPKYLLDKNVILVSGSYRLGIMGFLSTETLDCPGNFAFKDQLEVLRWVNKNIQAFGGDPNSVTIFGESAGAGSVSYLTFSEKSNKLFQKAIAQSGTIPSPWTIQLKEGTALARAVKLGELTGCKGTIKKLMSCLRQLPAEQIVSKFYNFFDWTFYPPVPFPPVIEADHPDAFLTTDPRLTEQRSLDKPIMIGMTSHEGVFFTIPLLQSPDFLDDLKNQHRKLFPIVFYYDHLPQSEQDRFTKAINNFYFKNGHDFDISNHGNFSDVSFFEFSLTFL